MNVSAKHNAADEIPRLLRAPRTGIFNLEMGSTRFFGRSSGVRRVRHPSGDTACEEVSLPDRRKGGLGSLMRESRQAELYQYTRFWKRSINNGVTRCRLVHADHGLCRNPGHICGIRRQKKASIAVKWDWRLLRPTQREGSVDRSSVPTGVSRNKVEENAAMSGVGALRLASPKPDAPARTRVHQSRIPWRARSRRNSCRSSATSNGFMPIV